MAREIMRVRGESIILNDDGTVTFKGGMTIDADGGRRSYAPPGSGLKGIEDLDNAGSPGNWYGLVCHGDGWPVIAKSGYFVSATTYRRHGHNYDDPDAYLDPEKEFFVVAPSPLRRKVKPVLLGCKVTVTDLMTLKTLDCVAGDIGPATHLGEASIAVADFFGVDSSPTDGGTDARRFEYTFHIGLAAVGYELQPV